jgi:hypothetical protein
VAHDLRQIAQRGFHQQVIMVCEVPHYVKSRFSIYIYPFMAITSSIVCST